MQDKPYYAIFHAYTASFTPEVTGFFSRKRRRFTLFTPLRAPCWRVCYIFTMGCGASRDSARLAPGSVPLAAETAEQRAAKLAELRRLWRVAHQRYVPFQQASPSRSRPAGVTDRNELDRLCNEYAAAWNARHPE